MAGPVPRNVVDVGKELVIVWDDGREDYLPLEKLRRECPCAMCRGERDLLGNVYRGPNRPLTSMASRSRREISQRSSGRVVPNTSDRPKRPGAVGL